MTRILVCLLAGALAGIAAAPASKPGAPATAKAAPPADVAIENAIKAKLARSKIGANGFKVRVQNGVAYWEGRTDVIQHKGAATRMAKTAGARRVVNNIQISEAGRAKAKAHLERGRRRAKVKHGEERSEPRSAVGRP